MYVKYLFFFLLFTTPLSGQSPVEVADSLYQKASEMNIAMEYKLGLEYATKAEAIYLSHKQWKGYYLAKHLELNFNIDLGKYEEAWNIYEQALDNITAHLGKHSMEEAIFYGGVGNLISDQNQDYEKAYEYYKKGLAILLELDTVVVNALNIAYGQLSTNRVSMGQIDEAIEYSQKAIDIIEKHLAPSVTKEEYLSFHYRTMGECYMEKGAFQKAFEYQQKALGLYRKVFGEMHLRTGMVYHSLADIAKELKNSDDAILYNKKALKIFSNKLGTEHLYVALTYNNLGNVFLLQKDYKKSLAFFKKTVEIAEKIGPEGEDYLSIAYVNLGLSYNELGQYKQAEYYILKALEMDQAIFGKHNVEVAEDYNYLSMCYRAQKKWDQALEANLQAILANTVDYTSTDPYLFKKALQEASFFTNPYVTVDIFMTKAGLLKAMYDNGGEKRLLKQALEGIMALLVYIDKTKQAFFTVEDEMDFAQSAISVYELGILIAGELYAQTKDKAYLRTAFILAEKNKSEALSNALRTNTAIKIGAVPDSLQQKEQELKENIAEVAYYLVEAQLVDDSAEMKTLELELFELKRKLETLVAYLEQEYPAYYELKYATDWVKAPEVQANLLQDQEMLLEYFVGDSMVYLFALTKEDINFYTLCTKEKMRRVVRQLREKLTNLKLLSQNSQQAYEQYCHYAYDFYKILVQPALDKQEITQLTIVPDDFLNFVPFEALLSQPIKQSSQTIPYQKLPYVLWKYGINYTYSARLLRPSLIEKSFVNQQVLAFAATYEGKEQGENKRSYLSPLPSVMREVKGLESKFSGKYLYGKEANEGQLRNWASEYSIVHLAMHGLLNSQHPELSCLAFSLGSDSSQFDDFLYAHEISNLTMNANLVVLSACETGYGKFEGGEGVMSLARSFMYAGIPSLVVSLWQVNDNATATIMELFYQNIAQGTSKVNALQQAKQDYLKNDAKGLAAHPNFWAAFVHLGKDGPIALELRRDYTKLIQWVSIGLLLLLAGVWGLFRKKREKA